MIEADKQEVAAMIAGATKPITDQVGQLAVAVKPVSGLVTQFEELGKNVKVVIDTMAADKAAATAAAGAGAGKGKGEEEKPKYLTAEDLGKALDDRDAKRAGTAAREKFIGEKLKGVPAAYHSMLGADESKWAAEEQAIRAKVQDDLKAMGVKVPNAGGAPASASQTELVKPENLPAEDFAKTYLPKVPGQAVSDKE